MSILYKCQLPLILAFNKVDVAGHEFALEWMADFETFQEAVDADSSYSSNLARSLCLVLDEFYQSLKCAGVSAVTGQGMDQFFEVWRFAPAHLAKLVAHRVDDIRTTSAKLGPREVLVAGYWWWLEAPMRAPETKPGALLVAGSAGDDRAVQQ